MKTFSKNIHGHLYVHNLAHNILFVILLVLLLLFPVKSQAENSERIISHFTNSLSTVYSASKSCENTIAPGPQEYMYLIATYLIKLYPNGVNYWVIPKKVALITDPVACIRLIQNRLQDYKNARAEYHNNYPNRNPAPILIAYQWDNTYFTPETPPPSKSYTPAAKPANNQPIKQKFLTTPSLQ